MALLNIAWKAGASSVVPSALAPKSITLRHDGLELDAGGVTGGELELNIPLSIRFPEASTVIKFPGLMP